MINYAIAYYVQVNIICMIVLGYIWYTNSRRYFNHATEDRLFTRLIILTLVLCIDDMVTWLTDGGTFRGARACVYISNTIYIGILPLIAYCWTDYVICKVGKARLKKLKVGPVFSIALILLEAAITSSVFTNFAFTVDEANVYHRTIGGYVAPVLAWLYIIFIMIFVVQESRKNRINADNRRIINGFFIPTLVASMIQIPFYGISVMQVGFTLSLLLIFINRQHYMISLDELTGLNNRRSLLRYFERALDDAPMQLCICILDVNKFKSINDTYGHLEGDHALRCIASVLRQAVQHSEQNWFLSRYGGDEFIISGVNVSAQDIALLKEAIHDGLREETKKITKDYELAVSFGYAYEQVTTQKEITDLLKMADKKMYHEKQNLR